MTVHAVPTNTAESTLIAAVSARATARHAHHEAGHAVAAVAVGGQLLTVFLGTADWSTCDDTAETPGATCHRTPWVDQPFVTFAGPWAEAMWTTHNDPEVDDFHEALDYAWDDSSHGDTAKYQDRIADVTDADRAAMEAQWDQALAVLWPAICQVATSLINGQTVTHHTVQAAINQAMDNDPTSV